MFIMMNIRGTYTGQVTGYGTDYNGRNVQVSAFVWIKVTSATPYQGGIYHIHGTFGTGRYNGKSIFGTFSGKYILTQKATVFHQPQQGIMQISMDGRNDYWYGPSFSSTYAQVQSSGTAAPTNLQLSIANTFWSQYLTVRLTRISPFV
jgi:hypothetical protein